jgi:hypothetical protein
MVSKADGKLIIPCWVDDDVVKALVDDNGRITVQLAGSDITLDVNLESSDITLPVEEQSPLTTIQARSYGWVNGDWHKNPIIRGYSSVARSYLTATSTGAGWVYAYTGAVPENYIRVIEGFTMQHSDPAAQAMRAGVWNTVTNVATIAYQNCPQYVYYGDSIDLTIQQDEKFFISAYAAGVGVVVSGYYACRQIYIGG